jgi:hypothetical protein
VVTVRHPAADEVCHCGQPARVVFETEGYGPVPYCGAGFSNESLGLFTEASSEPSS